MDLEPQTPPAGESPLIFETSTPAKENPEVECVRHPIYFFQDMIFLVDRCLFKIPRHHFKHLKTIDGFDDQHPYRLSGVKKEDMKRFLRVLYPGSFGGSEDFSVHEWEEVWGIANKLGVPNIKTLAVEKMGLVMDEADPVDRILLGRKHLVSSWQISGLQAMVKRAKPLGMADVNAVGIETILKIAEMRECCQLAYNDCLAERGEVASGIDCSSRIYTLFPSLLPPKPSGGGGGAKKKKKG